MRYVFLYISVAILSGCSYVRVIDADWNDPAIVQRITRIGDNGSGSVLLDGSAGYRSGVFDVSDSGLVFFDPRIEVKQQRVVEIRKRSRNRAFVGFLVGAMVGTAVGAQLGPSSVSDSKCPESDPFCGLAEGLVAASEAVTLTAFGFVTGGFVGALYGSPRVKVYRFRPGSSGQLSVVIGVSPPHSGLANSDIRR